MLRQVIVAKNLKRVTTSQNLSAAALNFTTSIGKPFQILEVLIRSSVAITETATVTLNSDTGSNYDHILGTMDFDGTQNVSFIAGDTMVPVTCLPADEIDVDVTADNATGIVYVTIKYEELY